MWKGRLAHVTRSESGIIGRVETSQVVHKTVELARIPGGCDDGCADRARWVMRELEGVRGTVTRDAVGNVAWFGSERRGLPALFAHLDTVFDSSVPHQPKILNGRLRGPGVGDNSLAIVMAVELIKHLDETRGSSALPLMTVFTVGEEGLGSLKGARYACREYRPRSVVALEGHGLDVVYTTAVGSRRVCLVVRGPGGHSWWDRGRPSSIHVLLDILRNLLEKDNSGVVVNVGKCIGGEGANVIASHAEALVEFRSLDDEVLRKTEQELVHSCIRDDVTISCQVLDRRPAGRLEENDPLYKLVRDVRESIGLDTVAADGSTDANAALESGISALALGCARGGNMHTRDEFVELASIPLGVQQLHRVAERLLEVERDPHW